jgi:hypothetical protein
MGQRIVLTMTVGLVCVCGGSALLASPALAGDVNHDTGVLSAAVYNLTPYPMTLVAAGAPNAGWVTSPPDTIPAGGGGLYQVNPYEFQEGGICIGNWDAHFDAFMTYRVDVLGGAPPEYMTVVIVGDESHGLCFGVPNRFVGYGVFDTTAPPPPGWDPSQGTPPGTQTPKPQLTYSHNVPYFYDQTIQAVGNYTVDASTNLGASFVSVLNTLCSGAANTWCSFTPYGRLTWGTGDPGSPFLATHCALGGSSGGGTNNTFSVAYTESRSASLTVGGGLTATAQFTLFLVVSNSISVSLEASHTWTENASFTRTSSVDIPPNDIAFLWIAPVVGKVTGQLVVSNGSATFTANNFTETRSGVTKDALTPAYDVITKVRPMTAAELQSHCQSSLSATLPRKSAGKGPVKLVPGQGVAQVSLGQTQTQVARQLGPPLGKQFLVDPCQGLAPRCYAAAGTGGRWSYRNLSVVFGPDLRVSALIYRGAQRTATGAGVGSSLPVVLGAYPGASCSRDARRMNCTLTGTNARRTVKTVFSFTQTIGGLYKCDRVLIYVIDGGRKEVSS